MAEILENNVNTGAELFELLISCLKNEDGRAMAVKSIPVRSARSAAVLIPVCCALGIEAELDEASEMPDAVLGIISDCLSKRGADVRRKDGKICCSGRLIPGYFNVPADVSSAFVCGMLFALPLLSGFSVLSTFGKPQDEELTGVCEEMLLKAGIKFDKKGGTYIIPPAQSFNIKD